MPKIVNQMVVSFSPRSVAPGDPIRVSTNGFSHEDMPGGGWDDAAGAISRYDCAPVGSEGAPFIPASVEYVDNTYSTYVVNIPSTAEPGTYELTMEAEVFRLPPSSTEYRVVVTSQGRTFTVTGGEKPSEELRVDSVTPRRVKKSRFGTQFFNFKGKGLTKIETMYLLTTPMRLKMMLFPGSDEMVRARVQRVPDDLETERNNRLLISDDQGKQIATSLQIYISKDEE